MKLAEIAHSRAGDKGNISTLSLIPFRESDYEILKNKITADRVKQHLHKIVKGEVVRYEMDKVHALLFVCYDALETGVTTSTAIDPHGKTLSSVLLEMEI